MLEDAPTIGDIYQWFDRLATLPIGQAAVLFFSKLGYLCDDEIPPVVEVTPSRFVYSLLPADRLLGDRDRLALGTVETCAKVTTFHSDNYETPSVDVELYTVDLKDSGSSRSEDAYGVHELFSKFNDHPSIVLFRCVDAILLSFLRFTDEGRFSIRLSDWLAADTVDNGQIDRMHIASCSLTSSFDLFDSLEFEAIRPYYKYPVTRYIAAYDAVFPTINLSLLMDLSGFTREAQDEAIRKVLDTYPDMYGDDYIDEEIVDIDPSEEVDLDDLEWEAQKIDLSDDDNLDNPNDPENEDGEENTPVYQMPPAEIMSDPIALLEWMDRYSGIPQAESHPANNPSTEPKRLRVVPIGDSPPAIGSHVRHIRLGEGVIDGLQGGHFEDDPVYISATFGSTARTFLFPSAFENGLVQLLA